MTASHRLRHEIISSLTTIAPEVDPDDLRDDVPLRDQVDLDSMDWLNFLVSLHERVHVEVAERDYGAVRTIADLVDYVERHDRGV